MKADILTSIFTRLRPALLASAKGVLRENEADAPDALQEAFCRLWRHRESFRSESHAQAASYTAVKNVAIDMVRRRRPTASVDEIPESPVDDAGDTEIYDEVDCIIRRELSVREREVLMMRDRHGFEMDAIAARLDTTEANVRLILSRARKKVRECYRNRNKYGK